MANLLLTENLCAADDSCQSEPGHKPQHCKHNVGVCKCAGEAKYCCYEVAGEKIASPSIPVNENKGFYRIF